MSPTAWRAGPDDLAFHIERETMSVMPSAHDGRMDWDRLCDTCRVRHVNAVLVAGSPGFVRFDTGLGSMKSPPLTTAGLSDMVREIVPASGPIGQVPGVWLAYLRYGTDCLFQLAFLGPPDPVAIVVTQVHGAPPPATAYIPAWPPGKYVPWYTLSRNEIGGRQRDGIFLGGAPPLAWAVDGVHVLPGAALDGSQIIRWVDQMVKPDQRKANAYGYLDFCGIFGQDVYRTAVFGYPASPLVFFLRMPPESVPAYLKPAGEGGPGSRSLVAYAEPPE